MNDSKSRERTNQLALIPFGIALNVVLGTIVSTLKLPVYLDAVATIAVTLLAGWKTGVIVGVGSFLLAGLLVNPVLPWFIGTQFVIASYTSIVARQGWLAIGTGGPWTKTFSFLRIGVVGVGLGIIAGIVSAPIIVWLFSGITGSGPSLIVAVLLKSGETLFKSVLLSGLASEPIDKTLQLAIAIFVIRSLPNSMKALFGGPYLHKNNLLKENTSVS